MKNTILITLILTASTAVSAAGLSLGDTTAATASANSAAIAGAAAGSIAGASSGGNTMTVNHEAADVAKTFDRYAPAAYAPSVQATVPCLVPINGGIGVPGGSLSLGTGTMDEGCQRREVIRMGLAGDALSQSLANQLIQNDLRKLIDEEPATPPAGDKAAKTTEGFDWSQLGG